MLDLPGVSLGGATSMSDGCGRAGGEIRRPDPRPVAQRARPARTGDGPRPNRARAALRPDRRWWRAWAGGVAGVLLVGLLCTPVRGSIPHAAAGMLLMVPVALAGAAGGGRAGLATTPIAALAYATLFLPPLNDPRVALGEDLVVLLAFLGTAVVVGAVAGRRMRRVVTTVDGTDELLRSVSHDLRTPLGTIQTVATDLARTEGYDETTRRELMDLVAGEADRLGRMVTSLLRASAGATAGAGRATPLDVGALLESAARRDPPGTDAPVVVAPGAAGLLVHADPVGVDQVLSNLVDNARRHCPGTARVTVGADRGRGGDVVIWVADDGPGPPPHLFRGGPGGSRDVPQPDRSSDVTRSGGVDPSPGDARSDGGFGLGLAICRRVVEAHGGDMWVERADGGGTRVCFSLPGV